jgi:hydrogenase maturation protease
MKTLVIGLGNPILGDDGVGWRVAEEIGRELVNQPGIEIDYVALGGLSLMERLVGYERVILVDSILTGKKPIGAVSCYGLKEIPNLTTGHSSSAHDTSLQQALMVGRSMDIPLPLDEHVVIVAVEAGNVHDFSEKLSPPVEAAVPKAVELVLQLIQ